MTTGKSPWRRRIAVAASALAVAGGVGVALGPGAPWIVDHVADGQSAGRLGRLRVDGVSGSWLGALHADHISIADNNGVWFQAEDVALDWRPFAILFGNVDLANVRAERVSVLRQPALSPPTPPGGPNLGVRIGALRINSIDIGAQTWGEAAQFSARLSLGLKRDEGLEALNLWLHRADSDADHIYALYQGGPAYRLHVDVLGKAGGILSRLLGTPDREIRASASGGGDARAGLEQCAASLGGEELLSCSMRWSASQWSATARARLDLLPSLGELRRRIGDVVAVNAHGARGDGFAAHVQTPLLAGDFNGALDARHELDGPLHFTATTANLSAIAHESPFPLGAARLEGDIRQANGATAIRAALLGGEAEAFGRHAIFSGPIAAQFGNNGFRINADFGAARGAPPLLANARLRAAMQFDARRGRFTLNQVNFGSAAASFDARGWVHDGDGEFSGAWRTQSLEALLPDVSGAAAGQWRAFAAPQGATHVWTTTFQGAGDNIGGSSVLAQLLAGSPRLDGMLRNENSGITVSHVRVDGARLRAGAIGRIVDGQANLKLEASARGPLNIGGAVISGAADMTGRMSGRLDRPALSGRAVLSSFEAGGVVVAHPAVDFTLAAEGEAYCGHAAVEGAVTDQPFDAAADITFAADGLHLSGIEAQARALAARGNALIGGGGVSADLTLSGALDGLGEGLSGRISGTAHVTPQTLAFDAQLSEARAGEIGIRSASISAHGPYDAIAAHVDMRGRLHQAPLTFRGNAAINASHGAVDAEIGGEGSLAGAAITTRTPMHVRWSDHRLETTLDVAMADGGVHAHWADEGHALSGRVDISDAPLAPLAAIWRESAEGRIDGHLALADTGGGLRGDADITLANARLAGRQRGRLNMHIVGNLEPSRLAARIDATSTDGLVAHFEANAPVETSAAPIRIALTPQRRGTATWSVHGPAESLWAAARLQDQSLQGDLNGEGSLQFGEGYLAGDGHIEIANGRFEDKLTGIALVNLNARVAIDQRGVTLERFTADGPHGGALTATGGSANPNQGRIAVSVENMRVADRPEARARANGQLTLAWQGLHSTLSGDLNILEGNLDIAANPEEGIPTINVVEVNQPDGDDAPAPDGVVHVNAVTDLNVRIRAPGRVFTRGRGVDAEWSLDLTLNGTSAAPRIFGVARAVRGTLSLSGQPFDIQDATITFDGDPLDARIDLTAERDATDFTATIRLTGTARNPEIALSSNPPLPEDEILPQVLFGHSVEDLSPFEAAQLAASLAALSGRASLDLVDAARAAAGLDRFNVRQDTNGGFLVSGGVYLTRGVYVELARTGLGQAQTQVEWTIRPRMVLITSFLANGDQRVSLRWRHESN
jgi:translocation and assembly module TamB